MKRVLLALVLLAAACVPVDPRPTALSPTERANCEARGGFVAVAGFSANEFCAELLPDAGQACRGPSDCTGYCDAQTRTCSTHANPYGCYSYLDADGQVVEICVD